MIAGLTISIAGQSKAALPTISSYALDKSRVTLPNDLSGLENVLVLYFEPDQSDAALAWIQAVNLMRQSHPAMQTYILPVYSRENFLYRWWIDASTRNGAPAAEDRHTTIPIFVDKPAFLQTIGIPSEKQPALLLTDKAGHILWKLQGNYESSKVSQLAAALEVDMHGSGGRAALQ